MDRTKIYIIAVMFLILQPKYLRAGPEGSLTVESVKEAVKQAINETDRDKERKQAQLASKLKST